MEFIFSLIKSRTITYRRFTCYCTLILFLLSGKSTFILAQPAPIKSTENVFFNKVQDTTYIRALLNKGLELEPKSIESAKHYFFEAYDLCRGQMPTAVKGDACAYLAWHYWMKAQHDSCIIFCEEAIAIEKVLHREIRLLHLYNQKSKAYAERGSHHLALLSIYPALELIQKNGRLRHSQQAPRIYQSMALLWDDLGEHKQKDLYLDTAFMLSQSSSDSSTRILILATKAFYTKDSTARNIQLRTALDMSKRAKFKLLEAVCLAYLGQSYATEGKPKDAFDYLKKALRARNSLAAASGDLQLAPDFYLAEAYFKNGQYALAERLLTEIIKKADLMQHNTARGNIHELLSEIYAAKHNYEAAYKHSELYKRFQDTTIRMEKEKTVEFLLQYQSLEKDKKIAQKELLITRQQKDLQAKNFWIGGISLGLLLSGALLLTLVRIYRHKQYLQTASFVNLSQQQRIDQLQTIMQSEERERNRIARELHDGVGSQMAAARMHLDVFKKGFPVPHYAETYKKGLQLLDDAYKGLRYTAHNLLPGQMLQRGLAPVLQEYCQKISRPDLLAIRFQSFGVLPDLAADKALSIYRMVQELIHNALKHAAATNIVVELGIEEQHLFVTVEDNGSGWDTTKEDAGSGIGLTNLKERIAVLKGVLEIDSRQGVGTTIYMNLPLNEIVT